MGKVSGNDEMELWLPRASTPSLISKAGRNESELGVSQINRETPPKAAAVYVIKRFLNLFVGMHFPPPSIRPEPHIHSHKLNSMHEATTTTLISNSHTHNTSSNIRNIAVLLGYISNIRIRNMT
jgi:hypothetical protein